MLGPLKYAGPIKIYVANLHKLLFLVSQKELILTDRLTDHITAYEHK